MAADFDTYGLTVNGVTRFADNAYIPNAPGNADWKEYQNWLAAGHTPRPLQPDPTYVWNGTAWVVDPALAQAANNAPLMDQLTATDRDSIRSMRNVVNTLARLSTAFMPPANTDQAFLVNAEMSARATRAKFQPPAVLSLTEAKAQKIERLRVQGLAYIGIGFIAQTIRWRATQDQIIYLNQCGFLVSSEILLPDSKLHIWDYTGVERALTPLNAGKLAGALNAWLYVAQQEFWAKVVQVNACTTNAQVDAITWTTKYTTAAPFNADTWKPLAAELLPAEAIESDVLQVANWI